MPQVHQNPSGCRVVSVRHFLGYLTAWCTVDAMPGVAVAVTVDVDGKVVGFEVHTDRTSPASDGKPPSLDFNKDGEEVLYGELTARRMREIPFGELADLTRAALNRAIARHIEAAEQGPPLFEDGAAHSAVKQWWHTRDWVEKWKWSARRVQAASEHRGRRGHPDRHYARIAVAYDTWLDTGKPLSILADELGLTVPGLRTALAKARDPDRGLLEPAPRSPHGGPGGRKGGRATPKAWQLAMEDDDGVD